MTMQLKGDNCEQYSWSTDSRLVMTKYERIFDKSKENVFKVIDIDEYTLL